MAHSYYHADGNGNVTMLINAGQTVAAKYLYDAFGNTLAQSGYLAAANTYRFSSKEWNANSGLYYYLYRFYDPNLQRWLNGDPIGESGFEVLRFERNKSFRILSLLGRLGGNNLYEFVFNRPVGGIDALGLSPATGPDSIACAHATEMAEAALMLYLSERSTENAIAYMNADAAQDEACKPPPAPPAPDPAPVPCPTGPRWVLPTPRNGPTQGPPLWIIIILIPVPGNPVYLGA
jgi:RHS repeat-associated protein